MSVSIIVPVYNVAPYVEACLQSVMRQSYTGKMECVVIDDVCTDDSMAIVERVIRGYDGPIEFRILHHEQNRGLSAARNTGTLQATGEYLYYIDSDDVISEECIEKLMQKASEDPSIEMVQGNTCVHTMQKDTRILVKTIYLQNTETNEEARKCYYQYKQVIVNVCNKLLRRDFIINHNIFCREGVILEDWLWSFYLLKHLKKASFMTDVTYLQKERPGSITTGTDLRKRMEYFRIVYQEILSNLSPGYEQEEFDHHAKWISRVCIRNIRNGSGNYDVLKLCIEKGRLYGSRHVRLLLSVVYYLGKFRYSWLVVEPLRKIYKYAKVFRFNVHRVFLKS